MGRGRSRCGNPRPPTFLCARSSLSGGLDQPGAGSPAPRDAEPPGLPQGTPGWDLGGIDQAQRKATRLQAEPRAQRRAARPGDDSASGRAGSKGGNVRGEGGAAEPRDLDPRRGRWRRDPPRRILTWALMKPAAVLDAPPARVMERPGCGPPRVVSCWGDIAAMNKPGGGSQPPSELPGLSCEKAAAGSEAAGFAARLPLGP